MSNRLHDTVFPLIENTCSRILLSTPKAMFLEFSEESCLFEAVSVLAINGLHIERISTEEKFLAVVRPSRLIHTND